MSLFAELEQRMAGVGNARLSNVSATANGTPFTGQFDIADRDAFDTVQAGDYTLRYLTSVVELARSDSVTLTGGLHDGEYIVADPPARLNGQESVVGLVRG